MPITPAPEEVFTIAPPPCLRNKWDFVLHAEEHAAKVDVDDPVPLLVVVLRGRSWLPRLDTSVVESEVEPAESLNCLGHRLLYILGPRHVTPNRHCARALFFYQAGRFLVVVLGHIGGHHAGALAGECQRRCTSDAAGGPGHEGDFPAEASVSIRCHFVLLSVLASERS